MKCKKCKRKIVDSTILTKKGCIWCDAEYHLSRLNSKTHKVVTLRTTNEEILRIPVHEIADVCISPIQVILIQNDKKVVFNKDNYYYPHWRYFIHQLKILFNKEEFDYV